MMRMLESGPTNMPCDISVSTSSLSQLSSECSFPSTPPRNDSIGHSVLVASFALFLVSFHFNSVALLSTKTQKLLKLPLLLSLHLSRRNVRDGSSCPAASECHRSDNHPGKRLQAPECYSWASTTVDMLTVLDYEVNFCDKDTPPVHP